MPAPRTDDFRMERRGDEIVLTFTPDGRTYTFQIEDGRLRGPICLQAGRGAHDHKEAEVQRMATKMATLALAERRDRESATSNPE